MTIRLETSRLLLRRFTGADVDGLASLLGDPQVMRYIDDTRPVPREVVADETLPAILREYDELPDGFGRFAAVLRSTGDFVGIVSLRPANSVGLDGGTELGYRLLPAHWGHGYATEGARALVDSAFADLGVDRVVATTMTVNVGSRRVLENAGLRHVRTFFAEWPEYIPGAEHGDVVYELTREDWAAGRDAAD
jgi:RimJ/RimL family protein N-acetyltransferase